MRESTSAILALRALRALRACVHLCSSCVARRSGRAFAHVHLGREPRVQECAQVCVLGGSA
eukprot:2700304-Pleurochrysis_carterae.AAC.1